MERLFVLKTLSRTQRATKVKQFVGFSLKPLRCRDPALPPLYGHAYSRPFFHACTHMRISRAYTRMIHRRGFSTLVLFIFLVLFLYLVFTFYTNIVFSKLFFDHKLLLCLFCFVVVHLFLCSLIVLCCRFFIIHFLFFKLFL